MTQEETDRKRVEQELHDHLRSDHAHDDHYTANSRFYAIDRSNVGFVRQWLGERVAGKRVLDYCCGNGKHALWLTSVGAEACGIDISPVSIDNARRAAKEQGLSDRVTFEVMDAEAMTFSDSSFDYAVINGVLHHLDLDRSYRELARVLKASGSVLATEALKHNPLIRWYRARTPQMRSAWEVEHILGRQEIFAARRYFHSVDVLRWFHMTTLAAVPLRDRPQFDSVLGVLERVDEVILRMPGLRWQAWMAAFELSRPKKT
jgi:ubiquinone/menaquinone biosynthesis C-methylase UbiE